MKISCMSVEESLFIMFKNFFERLPDRTNRYRYNLTVRARVDLIVVAAQENFFFHNSPKVVVGHGLKDYGVKNLFTM